MKQHETNEAQATQTTTEASGSFLRRKAQGGLVVNTGVKAGRGAENSDKRSAP